MMASPLSKLASLLPRRLHRLALKLAFRVRVRWQLFNGNSPESCALIVQNERGDVLLVRHSYCDSETWMLPGGVISRGETPLATANRELLEEVDCALEDARVIEFEDTDYWGIRYRTFIVGGMSHVVPRPDLREIEEAAYFPVGELPASVSEPTVARLQRWRLRNSLPFETPAFVRLDYVAGRHQAYGVPDRALN